MLHTGDHWRNEVQIGPYTVLASSLYGLNSRHRKSGSPMVPTWGCYLDEDWTKVKTDYSKIVIPWPDCGAINLSMLKSLVQTVREKLEAGETIDIACLLGHGRTGTLLACLLVDIEGLAPDAAISEVRHRHCEHAVEFEEQEELVRSYSWEMKHCSPNDSGGYK